MKRWCVLWLVALLLAVTAFSGCGDVQGSVRKKIYRPQGTKITAYPKLKLNNERGHEFWVFFKVRDKSAKYLLLIGDETFLYPLRVDRQTFYDAQPGQLYQINNWDGLMFFDFIWRNLCTSIAKNG